MNIRRTGLVLIGSVVLGLGVLGQAVQAAPAPSPAPEPVLGTVTLTPSATTLRVGDTLSLDIGFSFPQLADGFSLVLDIPTDTFAIGPFTPDPSLTTFPNFLNFDPGPPFSVTYAAFVGGVTSGSAGVLNLIAKTPVPNVVISAHENTLGEGFRFADKTHFNPSIAPVALKVLSPGTGVSGVSPVPLPDAVVLFLSGLGLLVLMNGLRHHRGVTQGLAA